MSIIRVGTTKKYADGWEAAFGGGKKKSAKPTKKAAKASKPAKAAAKSAKAKPAKKKAAKKR